MQQSTFLNVHDVDMHFGGLVAVDNLSFSVGKGQIKGLIGPNGAGKSTIFNVIAGVLKPTAGAVHFCGTEIQTLPAYRRIGLGIARTFQNLQIFPELTILENVMLGCHARFTSGLFGTMLATRQARHEEEEIRVIATEKLELLGMTHKAHQPASDLSFGEAKILEIARALAANPSLLLLDEPVAGVPHAEVSRVSEVIREINAQGISVLLVEHNMGFVMSLCDDILVLNYGRKIAEGCAEAVRTNSEVLTAYLGEDESHA